MIGIIRRLTFVIALALFGSATMHAQQLWPIDEASNDTDLETVRDALLKAVIDNDEKAVKRYVVKDVENGLDGDNGINPFMKLYRKRLRVELRRALENGGTLSDDETFIAPSIFEQFPDEYAETYIHGVIFGDSVNIRSQPNITSAVVDRQSWTIVEVLDWQTTPDESGKSYEWYGIRTLDGMTTGYVASTYLRSSADFRAVFRKSKGVWKLSGWYEGD